MDKKKQKMAREDKIALIGISTIGAAFVISVLLALRFALGWFGYVTDAASDGIGFKSAFITSIGISFFFMLIFALFAGDGVVGELGLMVAGFFVMIVFFTLSIAFIL